ncbi:MAG: shikimate kinase [Propionicimonas sp.]
MIVLVGFMGAGKSTVGRLLAERLGVSFADSDDVIEASVGLSIADIFEGYTEAGFRDLEARVIAAQLAGASGVLALGGGAVTTESVRVALAGHDVVLLDISLTEALRRIGGDPSRPLLNRPDLAQIFAGRAQCYRGVATLTVAVAGRSPQQIVEDVASALAEPDVVRLDPVAPEAGE